MNEPWHGFAWVCGLPVSMGSKKQLPRRGGKAGETVMVDVDRGLRPWQAKMRREMKRCAPPQPWDEPMLVTISVMLPRPQSHWGTGRNSATLKRSAPRRPKHSKDIDKIARAALDCAKRIWWVDDSRVADLRIYRLFVGLGDQARVGVYLHAEVDADQELPAPGWLLGPAMERLAA